jgi:hypothetical protein
VSRQLLSELRRSPRIVCRVPLVLIRDGAPIVAHTAVINRHGALILTEQNWPPESHFEMQNQKTRDSSRCRVVWIGGADRPGLYKIGVELLEDKPDFWGDDYPYAEEPAPA